jgi:hypothetical protein
VVFLALLARLLTLVSRPRGESELSAASSASAHNRADSKQDQDGQHEDRDG